MKYLSLVLLVLVSCGTGLSDDVADSPVSMRPNIILFYADDLGWTDLGTQGSDFYESPNIDRLAKDGMTFTNAYANASNCAPSRACLLSGLYPPRHGIYTVNNADRGESKHRRLIPVENTTVLGRQFKVIPEVLKENGYTTCLAGKWHLSTDPLPYGFDINFGGHEKGFPGSYFSPYRNPALPDGPAGEHLPARLSREVLEWIASNASQPFFVYMPFYSVHTPIQARSDLEEKYQHKAPGAVHNNPEYAAMIEAMDEAIGEVLGTVDNLNLVENTLILFTSDNGPHGGVSLVRPLRGTKGMFYEGGIREPFFARWPGVIPAGAVSDEPISGIDIFPTLMDITGTRLDFDLDGESLLPILKGGKGSFDRSLFWHFPAYLQMNNNNRGLNDSHDPPHWRSTPCGVIRDGNWKLIEYFETGETELFNLDTDPGEQNDLSETSPQKRAELYSKLTEWREQTQAPVPTELNPNYHE